MAKAPVTVAVSAVAWDVPNLIHGELLCVTVSHCAYFMCKARSFVFVWHHFIYYFGHWAYNAAK
jgi:hypothetical protein